MLIDTRTKSRAYMKAPKAGPMEGTPLLRLFCLDLASLATLCRGLITCILRPELDIFHVDQPHSDLFGVAP